MAPSVTIIALLLLEDGLGALLKLQRFLGSQVPLRFLLFIQSPGLGIDRLLFLLILYGDAVVAFAVLLMLYLGLRASLFFD